MKKIMLLLLTVLSLCEYSFAQNLFTEDEGKVTANEMEMLEYDKDPDAEALVIYDLGEYRFVEERHSLMLQCTLKKKIKILKQAGIKFADISIPFHNEKESAEYISDIKGTTYNFIDGKLEKTALDKKKIYEEKVDDNNKVKKFAMPDVKEGSVIEYSYTIKTPFYHSMPSWYFQTSIPVVHSKLMYFATPFYEYSFINKGMDSLSEFKSTHSFSVKTFGGIDYKEIIYEFGMTDVPAFKDEEFISSTKDYIMSLHFQMVKYTNLKGVSTTLTSTWPEINQNLLDNDYFGRYIRDSRKECKQILTTIDLEGKTTTEKIEILTDYVKKNYSWNKNYGKYVDEKNKDFLKLKQGNVANLNLFLVALLREAGIDANPMILSTRSNGAIKVEYPYIQFFNYVIGVVLVDEDYYFLDATEPFLPYTDLPTRCVNVVGLVVKPKDKPIEWLFTKQKTRQATLTQLNIEVDAEECKLNVNAIQRSNGAEALYLRKEYAGSPENLKKYYRETYEVEIADSVTVKNYEKTSSALVLAVTFEKQAECGGNKIFINPFCGLQPTTNPFKQTTRTLPVDLIYVTGDTYQTSIIIPKGYKVESLPSNIELNNEIVNFNYSTDSLNEQIIINAIISMKKNIYSAEEYEELKMSYSKIVEQLSEMIVLAKE